MSRLYTFIRQYSKLTLALEGKLCILTAANSHNIARTSVQSYNQLNICLWEKYYPYSVTARSFAKSKGKLKKGVPRIQINEQELSELFGIEKLYTDFKMPVDYMKKMYVEQLGLRTSANAIQDIKVKYDGSTYTIQDLAEIGRKGSKEILLDMGHFIDAVPSVLDSLRNSALNINPVQDGSTIIIPIPTITYEHRESLAKKAKALFNQCKDSIRNVQNKYIKVISNAEKLPEDAAFRLKAQITALGEKHVNEAEEIYKAKEKELLSTD